MAFIDSFLRMVVDQKASDLHFQAGHAPTIRYLGDLVDIPFRALQDQEARRFLLEILTPEQKAALTRKPELDFVYQVADLGRFRVNVFLQARGIGAVFRVIAGTTPTAATLRLPPSVTRVASIRDGLVLVCGPTGSGKTTTLAAIVDEINRTTARHILTIEDPVEYVHTSKKSVVTQRELHTHSGSWHLALKAALREAPDVLVIGELRDYESIALALAAAETGSLVLATLHTNSAPKALDRIVGACPDDEQTHVTQVLANVLRAVLAQQLCRLARANGRIAAVEVLLSDVAVANMIREGRFHLLEQHMRNIENGTSGVRSLDAALLELVAGGLIEIEEALGVASDRAYMQEVLGRMDAQARGDRFSLRLPL
jgi:twitching motility protein PilT